MTGRLGAALPLGAGFAVTEAAAYAAESKWLMALALLWLLPLPIFLARAVGRGFDPFEPIWVFSAVFVFTYAVIPVAQLWRPSAFQALPGYETYSPPHYYAAVWLGGAAFFAFCLAYFALRTRSAEAKVRADLDPGGVYALTFTGGILVAIGVLALETNLRLANATAVSARSVFTGHLRAALLQTEQGRGYINLGYLAFSTGLVCLAIAVAIWGSAKRQKRKRWVWAYFASAGGLAVILFALVLGSRNLAIATLVGLLVAFHFRWQQIPRRIVVVALCVLALGAIAFISLRNGHRLTVDPISMAGYASKTFDGFNFLVTALARVHTLLWGKTLGQDLLYTYLPRQLFHAKPTVYGIVVAQDTVIPGLSSTIASGSFPPGILAEGYLNFGVAGVLALPAVAALLLRLSYDWLTRTGSAMAVVVFGYLLGNLTGVFRGFGPVLPSLIVVLVLVSPLRVPEHVLRRARLLVLPVAGAVVLLAVAIPVAVHPEIGSPTSLDANAPPPLRVTYLPREVQAHLSAKRPTMVVFWASWCTPCEEALQVSDSVSASTHVPVLGIDFQDTVRNRERVLRRLGIAMYNFADDGSITIPKFRINNLPTVAVLKGTMILCEVSAPVTEASVQLAAERGLQGSSCSE